MVKSLIAFFLLFVPVMAVIARQSKPVLDTPEINNWLSHGENDRVRVSPDGKYFSYSIMKGIHDHFSTVVQGTAPGWKQEYIGGEPVYFSENSKQYVLKINEDLCFGVLGKSTVHYEKGIFNFQQQEQINPAWVAWQLKHNNSLIVRSLESGKQIGYDSVSNYAFDKSEQWIAALLNNKSEQLVLYHLKNDQERRYDHVSGYTIADNGKALVMEGTSNRGIVYLKFNEVDNESKTIWESNEEGANVHSVTFDSRSEGLFFIVTKKIGEGSVNSIWYYKPGMDKAILKASNQTMGTDGLLIKSASFNTNGKYIILELQEQPERRDPSMNNAQLDVWSYKDTVIQSVQLYQLKPRVYDAVISVEGEKVVRLQYEHETVKYRGPDFLIMGRDNTGDRFWEPGYKNDSNWIVWFKDGSRRLFPIKGFSPYYSVSPWGNYLLFFDESNGGNFFSYNMQTEKLINISAAVPLNQFLAKIEYDPLVIDGVVYAGKVAGWLKGDSAVLVNDNHDIWQLDLKGEKAPINITNGYGYKNKITFWISGQRADAEFTDSELLLIAYDLESRYNGFYRLKLGNKRQLERLYMGPYCFNHFGPSHVFGALPFDKGMNPLKATKSNAWIITRQSATEPPNYFLTRDFKLFNPLTNLQPQSKYNWISAELVRFPQADGTMSQGILYKPENFDSSIKYPVIINYYRFFSYRLYQYPFPDYSRSAFLNIAWFVSRGYLIFTPDIYPTKDNAGESCLNTVEGARNYLGMLSYVDSNRIGICGHSFGGSLTMYLVTHSNRFAAVLAGAIPATDKISRALGRPIPNNRGEYSWLEQSERSIGASIWEKPALWINSNPVMLADKVSMPLLIYHGEMDLIPLSQPLEMFFAMRRLNKPVWLLNYNTGGHTTRGQINAIDFTLRVTQFFDYYLKGTPPPRWMTEGIPARVKQIESRFELDTSGRRP